MNRQDESISGATGDSAFGFVSDGCGEGRHSELGARISVEVASRAVVGAGSLGLAELPTWIVREVIAALGQTLAVVAPADARRFTAEHLCATLLGFVLRGDEAVIFAVGDGLLRVDDEVVVLEAGARPDYPAYALHGGRPRVDVRRVRPTRALGVATDGITEENLRALEPRSPNLTRHLVLMDRRGELFDDGAVAMALRAPIGGAP